MAQLKSIRLRLDKPLTGPYDRLLRRPGPEVAALIAGETMAIIRGTRLLKAMPLWESETACYYAKGKADTGWSPEDFSNAQQAEHWTEKGLVNSLAVPVGYFEAAQCRLGQRAGGRTDAVDSPSRRSMAGGD